jgi:amino acid permease
MSGLTEPLVDSDRASIPSATPWSCYSALMSTMVGIGLLSLPISIQYCGLAPGILLLVAFGAASDASLQFLVRGAELTGATSYADLGSRCYGGHGHAAVVFCLLALLFASAIIIHICVTDLAINLAASLGAGPLPRGMWAAALSAPMLLLSLPHQLQQLQFAASGGVLAIAFCVVGMVAVLSARGVAPDVQPATLSSQAVLAMPIHSLAYACHFSVVELHRELPALRRHVLPNVIHAALASATVVYLIFGAAGCAPLAERGHAITCFSAHAGHAALTPHAGISFSASPQPSTPTSSPPSLTSRCSSARPPPYS